MNIILSKVITVLVLGVGGNIGQGILKALNQSKLQCRIIGADNIPLSFGLYTVDKAYVSPKAEEDSFIDWVLDVCKQEGVKAVLSGVESVLTSLSRNAYEIHKKTGAVCIVSPLSLLSISNDKLSTCRWLMDNGFNFPHYAPSEDIEAVERLVKDFGFPLIGKPRLGKGSNGLIRIDNHPDLTWVPSKTRYIIEEYLNGPEYTVGCFCDRDRNVRGSIVMLRELKQGTTYRAEVGDFPKIREEATRIVAAIKPMGPCNIQMIVSNEKPTCFEINMRFSGTTPIRARLGFNEVEAAIRNYVLNESIEDFPLIKHGMALRYWNEMYIDSQSNILSTVYCPAHKYIKSFMSGGYMLLYL